MLRTLTLVALCVFGLQPTVARAAPAPSAVQQPAARLQLKFDYAGVEGFLRAAHQERLDDASLQAIARGRGTAEMVKNTVKYFPDTPADGYASNLQTLVNTGKPPAEDPYGLKDAVADLKTVEALVSAVRKEEPAMSARVAQLLARYWPGDVPLTITVYLVVGGASDGFVVDGDPTPEFFIAIDKASGDLVGLEQNVTHESVHVVQRQLALRHCPPSTPTEQLPAVARFQRTIYEEGVANYLADPARLTGTGDYISMWRSRYARNATPQRMRENTWLYGALLQGLRQGRLSWDTAYQIGFFGNLDSRMYFVGRELARQRDAEGTNPLSVGLVCHPERLFKKR